MLDTVMLASAMTRNKSSLQMWVVYLKTWLLSDQLPSKDPRTRIISSLPTSWIANQQRLATLASPNFMSSKTNLVNSLAITIPRLVNISKRKRCKAMAWISLWSMVRTSLRLSGAIAKSTWLQTKKKELKSNWEWKKRKSSWCSCTGTTRMVRESKSRPLQMAKVTSQSLLSTLDQPSIANSNLRAKSDLYSFNLVVTTFNNHYCQIDRWCDYLKV